MFKNPINDFNALFSPLGNSTCSSPEVVLVFLLYEGSTVHNASDQFVSCVYFSLCRLRFSPFIHPHRRKSDLYAPTSTTVSSHPLKIGHLFVYMNLFTRNSPYYHLLKYLLFLLKHLIYIYIYIYICMMLRTCISHSEVFRYSLFMTARCMYLCMRRLCVCVCACVCVQRSRWPRILRRRPSSACFLE